MTYDIAGRRVKGDRLREIFKEIRKSREDRISYLIKLKKWKLGYGKEFRKKMDFDKASFSWAGKGEDFFKSSEIQVDAKEVFEYLDTDLDGFIAVAEFQEFIMDVTGIKIREDEIEGLLWKKVNADKKDSKKRKNKGKSMARDELMGPRHFAEFFKRIARAVSPPEENKDSASPSDNENIEPFRRLLISVMEARMFLQALRAGKFPKSEKSTTDLPIAPAVVKAETVSGVRY